MLFSIVEMIGTVAFAIAGAMTAINRNMDLLGIIVLGEMTAVGGGCFRDILLGRFPASMFVNPVYVIVALAAILCLFLIFYFGKSAAGWIATPVYDRILNVLDAVGLGAFTVTGINVAIECGHKDNVFFVIFLGVITGVGGGIFRDVLSGQPPAVFRKHIYACASIVGAFICYYGGIYIGEYAVGVCIAAVTVIRILAYEYRWDLPKIHLDQTEAEETEKKKKG